MCTVTDFVRLHYETYITVGCVSGDSHWLGENYAETGARGWDLHHLIKQLSVNVIHSYGNVERDAKKMSMEQSKGVYDNVRALLLRQDVWMITT